MVSNYSPRFQNVPVFCSVDFVERVNEAADSVDVLNCFLDHLKIEGYHVDFPHPGRTDGGSADTVVTGTRFVAAPDCCCDPALAGNDFVAGTPDGCDPAVTGNDSAAGIPDGRWGSVVTGIEFVAGIPDGCYGSVVTGSDFAESVNVLIDFPVFAEAGSWVVGWKSEGRRCYPSAR